MADYTGKAATATKLIDKFGGAAKLIKSAGSTGPDYDPTPLPPTETTITIVDLNIQERDRAGTLIGTAQRTIYAKGDADIKKGDQIEISGVAHEVGEVMPLQPAPDSVVILFEVKLVR